MRDILRKKSCGWGKKKGRLGKGGSHLPIATPGAPSWSSPPPTSVAAACTSWEPLGPCRVPRQRLLQSRLAIAGIPIWYLLRQREEKWVSARIYLYYYIPHQSHNWRIAYFWWLGICVSISRWIQPTFLRKLCLTPRDRLCGCPLWSLGRLCLLQKLNATYRISNELENYSATQSLSKNYQCSSRFLDCWFTILNTTR